MSRSFRLTAGLLSLIATYRADAAPLYWDGPIAGWDVAANWSTDPAATTPDPAERPGALDVATFNITGVNTATTVSLNGDQAALGLSFVSTGAVTLQGGGSNRTLSLGASGITAGTGTTALNVGSATANQNVNLSLITDQTWAFNGANIGSNGIFIRNAVSLGFSGDRTLTLGGTTGSTAVSGILGNISDGAGVLSLTLNGATTNRWNLSGANSYSGATTITSGALGIATASSLGTTTAGTTVANGAALFFRNTTTVSYNAEPLTIAGIGPAASARGALRQVASGTSTWNGPITANASAGVVRIGADAGTLIIAGNISTTGSNALNFEATGVITVSGNISGSASLTKSVGGGTGTGTNDLTLSGSNNTYTGSTTVSTGTLAVNGNLVNTSAVTVAVGASIRGNGTINNAALTTVNGTLGPGASAATIGTLGMGALTLGPSAAFALDFDTTAGLIDKAVVNGNLSLDSGNTVALTLNELNANATPLAVGTAFTFIDYSGTWNGGLFRVGGQVISDDTGMFTAGANSYAINYDAGVNGNDVQLVVVPEPGAAATLLGGLGLLLGAQRLRRRSSARGR